jgi:hypothetical protein
MSILISTSSCMIEWEAKKCKEASPSLDPDGH